MNNKIKDTESINKTSDFQILIPTLNRPKAVEFNQRCLVDAITIIQPAFKVQIVISDNASDDDKRVDVTNFKDSLYTDTTLILREKRIELGKHMNWLSHAANAKWHLWLGDDDILCIHYLSSILLDYEKNNVDVNCVLCDNIPISDSDFFSYKHEQSIKTIETNKITGVKNNYKIIARGNQLSGILIKRSIERIVWDEHGLPQDNLYPWMGFIVFALKNGYVLSCKNCPALITSNTQKHFTYRDDGLLPEIADAVKYGLLYEANANKVMLKVLQITASPRIMRTNIFLRCSFANYIKLYSNKKIPKTVFCALMPKVAYDFLRYYVRFKFMNGKIGELFSSVKNRYFKSKQNA